MESVMLTELNVDSDQRSHADRQQRASNVCLYCRRRKKKCDKTLPSCLQCKKHHIECVYDDVEAVSAIDEFRQLRRRLKTVEGLVITGTSKHTNLDWLPAGSTALKSRGKLPLVQRLEVGTTEPDLSEEIHHLLQYKPGEVYGACQIYFQNIHRWIPVISQKLFYRRMTEFSQTRRADFALLLLCILLLIHYPTSNTKQEPLYEIAKIRYWYLHGSAEASIELLQAGILLATYEYGSSMIEASYKTTGLCALQASWMGLHNQGRPSDLLKDSDAWLENVERRNVWWAIIIRDRCIRFQHTALDKPCAVDRSAIPDYLPLEAEILDPSFTSMNANEILCIFGRQAQACRLLDRAIYFHQQQAIAGQAALEEEKNKLDLDIRRLLETLIHENGGSICDFCEASAIVIGTLFVLHSESPRVVFSDRDSQTRVASAASAFAREAATRIVIDIARNFNGRLATTNMISRPATYCYVMYRAAMVMMPLYERMGHTQWYQDMEILRESSWNYSRRWQAAANHLKSIDNAIAQILPEPPPTFSSFQPLRNNPCLVTLLDE